MNEGEPFPAADSLAAGQRMYELLAGLFPICRSITGDGVRETLAILSEHIPLQVHEVPTGTRVLDWTVPREWNIREAFIEDPAGRRIVDVADCNLHVVGYSVPVDRQLTLAELQAHLHSVEAKPDAIPYITSYYKERWGFCLSHRQRMALQDGTYRVRIDSELKDGHLTYGECLLPGETTHEIFLSTYICHPSMANNELSGPVVAAAIAKWVTEAPRRYTYRIVFVPETIGAITYLSRHLDHLKEKVIAGFNLSCLGDDRAYSLIASRYGNTLADRVARHVLAEKHPGFVPYSYRRRGSDERQYGSPGVDLPLVTLCRTKFGEFPEYHSSLDNLDVVSPAGLQGGFELVRDCCAALERNRTYQVTCLGEPQLGRRGLYPEFSTRATRAAVRLMVDLLAYCDGTQDLLQLSELLEASLSEIYPEVDRLVAAGLLAEA